MTVLLHCFCFPPLVKDVAPDTTKAHMISDDCTDKARPVNI